MVDSKLSVNAKDPTHTIAHKFRNEEDICTNVANLALELDSDLTSEAENRYENIDTKFRDK